MTQPESPERIAERIVAGVQFYCANADGRPSAEGADENRRWLREQIAQALADERRRVREECAGIAEAASKSKNFADRSPSHIAAAIRAAGNP